MTRPAWFDRRPETCVSHLQLYRFIDGELGAEDAAREELVQHVQSCRGCTQRLEELRGQRHQFDDMDFVRGLATRAQRRLQRGRTLVLAGLGAAIVAGLTVGLLLGPFQGRDDEPTGTGVELTVFVQLPAGHVERVGPGGLLAAGEQVRFQVTRPRAAWLGIVGLDSSGRVTVYAPAKGQPQRIVAGPPLWVADAVRLSDTVGEERVFVVQCPDAFGRKALRQAGRNALAAAGGDPGSVEHLPLDCPQSSARFEKVP